MNKLLQKVAKLTLGLAMAAGVGVAVGNSKKQVTQTRALTASDISSTPATTVENGAKYVIASGTSGNVYLGAVSGSWGSAVAIGSAYEFTAEGSGTSGFALKCSAGYLTPKTSNSNTFAAYGSTSKTIQFINTSELASGAQAKYNLRQNGGSGFRWYGTTSAVGTTGTAAKLYKVNAAVAVTSVSVSPTSTSIGVGGTATLTATISPSNATDKTVTWSSSNPSVATVSGGTVTAVAAGETTITVKTNDGNFTATCAVTVTAPVAVTGVSLNKSSTTIEVGSTETLTATISPSDASNKNVSWTSSDTSVATVANGVVTAVSKGSSTITVTTADGSFTDTCSVNVTLPSSVNFTYGTDNSTGSTLTKGGTTLTIGTPGTDGTFDINNNNCYKVYKGKTLVVSSSQRIAKVEFTCTAQGTSQYGPGCFVANVGSYSYSGYDGTWTGSATSITFTASSNQTRPTVIVVTYENSDPSVSLDASSATSVSMLRQDTDTSVKVLIKNIQSLSWSFTFDEDEDEGLATSAYINVSPSALVSDVSTLTITTKAVGSTTIHISVSGTACTTSIPVTVNARPASMMVTESDHETQITTLELQSGGSAKRVYWIGEDSDGNPYSIAAAQVNGEIISGNSYVSISSGAGTDITPTSAGTAVIRYSLKVLSSVYAEITVNVVDDYKTTVNEISFNSNLSDTQGDAVNTSEVIATRVANTHFGSTASIDDNELLFSYENNRSGAEAINIFSYDFTHGTTIDSTHKTQTVYVFTTFDSSYSGSFTITVEQKNDPLTAITITNVTDNELELSRGGEFQLEIGYTPTNPTDGKEVVYRVDESDSGVSISVSSAGLISVSESSGLGAALIVVESAHDETIYDWVDVSVTLESMSYQINETESWSVASSLSVGDRVVIAGTHSDANYELTGVSSNIGQAVSFDSDPTGTFVLTVGEGNAENSFTFSNGTSYLAYTLSAASGSNYLHTISNPSTEDQLNQVSWTVSISDGSATITNVYNTNRKILFNYNNGSPRYCAYTSAPSTTMHLPAIYKLTGGLSSKNVDETLFNGVHNNFGAGKTYAWDEVCSSFNSGNWSSAGTALKGISGFANYKLERAVGDINGNEIEQFIAKYDIIIGKFSTADDFLGRFGAGGINYGSARVVPMINIVGNTNTVAIIVIISMVSVTAIGGYFFIRKRKEN